ncbi:hypothetical protein HBN50_13095 [Halobacteriovorax sp. GB3]|uniref:hypothetical protein n=1 Tax=Halobacteriovorax sp. GB3 TaxID=2719615 RepID=UPI0023615712|nr:hypothetical protein [Halobacteriovorax sp. GB3]MDD0854042.1 hypothetical protein [Halobacteriovorax sp. GB3]
MDFSLAHIKSENQLIYRVFSQKNEDFKVMDLEELDDLEVQGLFYDDELYESEQVKLFLQEQSKFLPIRSSSETGMNSDEFSNVEMGKMRSIFEKISSSWVLQNNITLLEELFPVIDHLNAIWPNDRTTFFEELWFILKNNLGAKELKIIFNDIEMGKKENEKNKLIKARIEGKKLPHPFSGGEFEDKVMGHYEEEFNQSFNVVEYDAHKGELVIAATIKKSPVLIMAKVYDVSRIQQSVLKTLFTGLSRE